MLAWQVRLPEAGADISYYERQLAVQRHIGLGVGGGETAENVHGHSFNMTFFFYTATDLERSQQFPN